MDVYYTDTFRGNRIEKFVDEENELRNLVDSHFITPSFNNNHKIIKLGDTINLLDENNVLNNYEIVNNDLINTKINGNTLEITAKNKGNTTLKLQKKSNKFGSPLLLWSNPISQDLVTTGDYDTIEVNLNIDVYDSKLEINKIGEDVNIKDGKYEYVNVNLKDVQFNLYANENIYDNNILKYDKDDFVSTLSTDDNGYAKLDNLYYGKYKLIETKSSLNNEIEENEILFEITNSNNYIKLDVTNKLDRKTLEFTKIDKDTNTPLPDTTIEIYTSDNQLVYSGVTNNEGKIILDDLFIGKFYIKEVKAKDGYKLSDNIISFEIKKDDKDPIKIVMTNEIITDVPNTFKNKNLNYQFIFSILILGIGIYNIKNKNEF